MSRADVRTPTPVPGGGGSFAVSTTSAVASTALAAGANHVHIWSTVAGYVSLGGSSATADTSDMAIPANSPVFLKCGEGQYVAFEAISGSGTCYYCAMTH